MPQVPAAPDAAALAARLDDLPGENADAVAPAPAQLPVQEPQAVNVANVDQPAQGQAQEAQQLPQGINEVLEKVRQLQQMLEASKVDQALETVKRLANRPRDLIDPFTLLASLEQLADYARESGHADKKKFEAIFKQCRPLVSSPNMARVVIHRLGDKEDRDVAQQIGKIMKSNPAQGALFPLWRDTPPKPPLSGYSGSRRGRRGWNPSPYYFDRRRCFSCNKVGHLAGDCQESFCK
ncbi:uncharacterized protein LOC144652305 [Oculina patagonica]